MIDDKKIDLIIQFALLVAGQEDDFFSRKLGPIHLLKYVYLADVYYAEKHVGETFTDTDWVFFNFGPWSPYVHSRIEPSLQYIRAEKDNFESKYGGDVTRWYKTDDDLLSRCRRSLPSEITVRLKNDVHKYLTDTPSLLDYVYKTKPMLVAAPSSRLDFTVVRNEVVSETLEEASYTKLVMLFDRS